MDALTGIAVTILYWFDANKSQFGDVICAFMIFCVLLPHFGIVLEKELKQRRKQCKNKVTSVLAGTELELELNAT